MKDLYEHNHSNRQKWDRRSKTYDKKRFDYFRYKQKKAISQMNLHENINFLDLGCGTGWAVIYAANLLHGHGNYMGIDISEGMIEKARENSTGIRNVIFYKASSEELPFEDNYFDKILCTNSFHHYLNPDRVLFEIYRVLRPNGEIYILDMTADDFFGRWINKKFSEREPEHIKFYSTYDYKEMFSNTGLSYRKSKSIKYPLKLHIAGKL